VYFFFEAVARTSAAEANMLNLTYPVFIAIFSFFFFQHKGDYFMLAVGPLAFVGILAILGGDGELFDWNSCYGIASGVSAAFAIVFLNLTRLQNDTDTILFYLFGIGTVIAALFVPFDRYFEVPAQMWLFLLGSSVIGVLGQISLTYGYRFVTALEGSILSSTRILLAAVLGPVVAGDPALGVFGWCGALLIFGCNVFIAWRKFQLSSNSG
jgi:drug/metabolite transporter (DMT)-like permease